jgi:hypothetical protein
MPSEYALEPPICVICVADSPVCNEAFIFPIQFDLLLLCRVKGCISIFFDFIVDAVDGMMWNPDKSASYYCLHRYIDLYF